MKGVSQTSSCAELGRCLVVFKGCRPRSLHRRAAHSVGLVCRAKKASKIGRCDETVSEQEAQMYVQFGNALGQSLEQTTAEFEARGGGAAKVATAIRKYMPSEEALEAGLRGAAAERAAGDEEQHGALGRAKAKATRSEEREALRREALRELMANAAMAKASRSAGAQAYQESLVRPRGTVGGDPTNARGPSLPPLPVPELRAPALRPRDGDQAPWQVQPGPLPCSSPTNRCL